MKTRKSIDPSVRELTQFSSMVWKELSPETPAHRQARRFASVGLVVMAVSVASFVLYLIYRSIGDALIGPTGPLPSIVWMVAGAGALLGAILLAIGAFRNRRRTEVAPLPAHRAGVVDGANGHLAPPRAHLP